MVAVLKGMLLLQQLSSQYTHQGHVIDRLYTCYVHTTDLQACYWIYFSMLDSIHTIHCTSYCRHAVHGGHNIHAIDSKTTVGFISFGDNCVAEALHKQALDLKLKEQGHNSIQAALTSGCYILCTLYMLDMLNMLHMLCMLNTLTCQRH
jgi:hypothetical protein